MAAYICVTGEVCIELDLMHGGGFCVSLLYEEVEACVAFLCSN